MVQHLALLYAGEGPVPAGDEKVVRIDGAVTDVEVTAWRIPFEGRTVLQVTLVDISERKRTVSRLQGEHEHLRNVLDSLFTFVGVLSPEGRLLEANRAPLEAAGLRPHDVQGKLFWDAWWWSYSEAVQQQLRDAIRKAQEGVSSRYDVAVRMKDESRMIIDFMLVPMRDRAGVITHLIASAVDITDRKRAADELRNSEERFRSTFENAAVGIAHVGLDGRWIRLNQRYCDITGYSRDELMRLRFQDITHPDDLDSDLDLARQLRDGVIPSYTLEKRYIKKDGSEIWVNLTGSSVRNARPERSNTSSP